ncbi:unnamed protein product [Soboliphyme baturini]|uniref:tRNA-synt_2 domain-containing protein n=1 Tax=Soboliphyme baturini TaxID=241478 RepID=A0A183IIM8_9BILA|nr:unnamed protein product [Soboliphyme baturini]
MREIPVAKEVSVVGWVRHVRDYKDVSFCSLTDGLSEHLLEIVVPQKLKHVDLHTGCAVKVSGIFNSKTSCQNAFHVDAEKIEVVASCDLKDYPFAMKKRHPPEYLRLTPHLRPRTTSFAAFLRVRSKTKFLLQNYLQNKNFVLIDCPILTGNDCENAGEAFPISQRFAFEKFHEDNKSINNDGNISPYFGHPVYLTVSGQFHLEAAAW